MTASAVIWHDLECGAYQQDIAMWLGLASQLGGPVLDVGAGTGRVALQLARAGHEVIALDRDPVLLSELELRAGTLSLRTVCADARDFELGDRLPLCVVPMQTIQLLGGPEGRGAFLRCAREHLLPGGLLAVAIVERLELFEVDDDEAGPLPDMRELDGVLYSSRPTAVRQEREGFVLERRRETVTAGGTRQVGLDRIGLDRLSARQLGEEARALGLRPVGVQRIPATNDHVGSQVVMLRA